MNRRSLPCFALWFMPLFHRPLCSGLAVGLLNDSATMEEEGSWVEVFSFHSGHSLRSSRWCFRSFSTNVFSSSNNNNDRLNQYHWKDFNKLFFTGWCVLKAYTGLNGLELHCCVITSVQDVQGDGRRLFTSPPPLLPHERHICSPLFYAAATLPSKTEGWAGRWKGKEGKREARPERMRDKDGSKDILSTFISSGGGERRWILAYYWQSLALWWTAGEHVTIKSSPPHFHLPHWGRGTYGAGCQLLILYGN